MFDRALYSYNDVDIKQAEQLKKEFLKVFNNQNYSCKVFVLAINMLSEDLKDGKELINELIKTKESEQG